MDDGARLDDALGRGCGVAVDIVLEDQGAEGRAPALDGGLVLDGAGDALQRPEPPVGLHVAVLGLLGFRQSAVEMLHRKGVDLGLDGLGPGDQRAHQLDGRELARFEGSERLGGAEIAELGIRHDLPPVMVVS
jgi:hypothetical protein